MVKKRVKLNAQTKKEMKANIEWIHGKKYIWIDGYKATNKDMYCRDEQYELNVLKEFKGDPVIGVCGYHFSTKLKETFNSYELNGLNRYFKVRALIEYVENPESFDRLSAKKIILKEEVPYEEMESLIKKYLPLVRNKDDYKLVNKMGYDVFVKTIFISKIQLECGFSEAFSNIIYNRCERDKINALEKIINLTKALKEENISKDLLIYFVMEECDNW